MWHGLLPARAQMPLLVLLRGCLGICNPPPRGPHARSVAMVSRSTTGRTKSTQTKATGMARA